MTHEQFLEVFKQIFKDLIQDGYKASPMCNVTLGTNRNPQFKAFIEDKTKLGILPLKTMVDGLEYDLHLVPIAKDDTKARQELDEMTSQFIINAKQKLIDYMENRPVQQRTRTSSKSVFEDTVDNLLNELDLLE